MAQYFGDDGDADDDNGDDDNDDGGGGEYGYECSGSERIAVIPSKCTRNFTASRYAGQILGMITH